MTLPNCRNNCNMKVEDDLRKQLFCLYWSMNEFNRRTAYIASLITRTIKKVNFNDDIIVFVTYNNYNL